MYYTTYLEGGPAAILHNKGLNEVYPVLGLEPH